MVKGFGMKNIANSKRGSCNKNFYRKEEVILVLKGMAEAERVAISREEIDSGVEIETKIVKNLAMRHASFIENQNKES